MSKTSNAIYNLLARSTEAARVYNHLACAATATNSPGLHFGCQQLQQKRYYFLNSKKTFHHFNIVYKSNRNFSTEVKIYLIFLIIIIKFFLSFCLHFKLELISDHIIYEILYLATVTC